METLLIAVTLFGSFLGAVAIQKMALEGLFRAMNMDRRTRE